MIQRKFSTELLIHFHLPLISLLFICLRWSCFRIKNAFALLQPPIDFLLCIHISTYVCMENS